MLKLVPNRTHIKFLGKRRLCLGISILLLLATLGGLLTTGLNFGIDFAGGMIIQTKTERATAVTFVRAALEEGGVKGATIQEFGSPDEYLIRIGGEESSDQQKALVKQVREALSPIAGTINIRRVEYVGPQIGGELRQKGGMAVLFSMIAILFYISIRFEMRYGVGAVAALAHDVLLTIGVFVLLQKEVTLPVLAALLTVIGYSLNDTIVVFDRVRENRRKYRKRSLESILDLSINDMLGRTLMTSLTTLVVLLALFFLGGSVIHDFAFTLMFGVIVGTYSSIYVAAPVVMMMEKYYKPKPEGENGEPSEVGQKAA